MNMDTLDFMILLIEAAALGALIGIEREVVFSRFLSKKNTQIGSFGWVRSYALISLLWALSVYMWDVLWHKIALFIFLGSLLFLFILISYIHSAFTSNRSGVTSEIAALIVFVLGALIMLQEVQIAVFVGVFLAITLDNKSQINTLVKKIWQDEISTTLKFAVISLVILPILPDHRFSLYEMLVFLPKNVFTSEPFFNPYSIWFFVVVMSAISYIGYFLSKTFDSGKSIMLSWAIGWLVSSTAVASVMAEKSKEGDKNTYPTAIATLTASMIMFVRVIGIVLIFNPVLLSTLFLPLVTMILVSYLLIHIYNKKNNQNITNLSSVSEKQESPFSIIPALKFAAFVVIIKFVSTYVLVYEADFITFIDTVGREIPQISQMLHHVPKYIIAFFSGLADVDAITQDMAEKSLIDLSDTVSRVYPAGVATLSIVIAIITNTCVKIALALKFWSKQYGKIIFRSFSLIMLSWLIITFLMLLIAV